MQTDERSPVRLSVDAFRLMLGLYPPEFRAAYGPDMALTFRDVARQAYRRAGSLGLLWLWASTFFDVLKSALEQHTQQGVVIVSKEKLVRLAGPMIIVGGLFWMIAAGGQFETQYWDDFGGVDVLYEIAGLFLGLAFIPLSIGFYGLFQRLRSDAGPLARIALILASVGALATVVGWLLMGIVELATGGSNEALASLGWSVGFISLLVMLVGLLIFGIVTLGERLLPRWNATPLLASVIPLVYFMIQIGYETVTGASLEEGVGFSVFFFLLTGLMILLMGVSLTGAAQPQIAEAA